MKLKDRNFGNTSQPRGSVKGYTERVYVTLRHINTQQLFPQNNNDDVDDKINTGYKYKMIKQICITKTYIYIILYVTWLQWLLSIANFPLWGFLGLDWLDSVPLTNTLLWGSNHLSPVTASRTVLDTHSQKHNADEMVSTEPIIVH